MNPLAPIESLARQLLAGEITIAQLPGRVAEAGLGAVPPQVWDELESRLARDPRSAQMLAVVLREIARQLCDWRLEIRAELALARALNARGEFGEALELSQRVAAEAQTQGNFEASANVWHEAAWACTFLGDLKSARHYLEKGAPEPGALGLDAERWGARGAWIQGRILREQGELATSIKSLEQAREAYEHAGERLDAARCGRELGQILALTDPTRALQVLSTAREVFRQAHCPTETALCDLYLGQAHIALDHFQAAHDRLAVVRPIFVEFGLDFFAASCDLDAGFLEWRLNHFDAALHLFEQAHAYFLSAGAQSEASSCEINLANILCELNRYEEGFARFEQSAEHAQASEQPRKLAVCLANMGWVRTRQGRYADALHYYQRARREFDREHLRLRIAQLCDLNIGLVYLRLGEYEQAREALEAARAVFVQEGLIGDLAECEMHLTQVLLELDDGDQARLTIEHARDLFAQTHQEVYAAVCDRLLALLQGRQGDRRGALARLAASRSLFAARGMQVDVALCDLAEGELCLEWHEYARAEHLFERARGVLGSGFPDQSWRVDYGLGRIAEARRATGAALTHYLDAVQTIAGMRADLVTEQLGNAFFGSRPPVYEDALRSALKRRDGRTVLNVIEAAKARLLLAHLARRDWGELDPTAQDRPIAALQGREAALRHKLAELESRVAAEARLARVQSKPRTAAPGDPALSQELAACSRDYEAVVAELRLARPRLAGNPSLPPFALDEFRARANACLGRDRWAALEYHVSGECLTVVYVDADDLEVTSLALSARDRFLLDQCASDNPGVCERVYRGTALGMPAPSFGDSLLAELAPRLLPRRLLEMKGERTLIVSPHRRLHQLPFHVLKDDRGYLLERFTIIYTPALEVWSLLHPEARRGVSQKQPRLLLCGLDRFGDEARPLTYARHQVQELQRIWNGEVTVLWGPEARRQTLLEMNASGELARFDVLHFVTHAVIKPHAPHWSRILLADEPLTVRDILDLKLDARLVTLAACSTALGTGGEADEWVAFRHALGYAGARAIAATLWPSEDSEGTTALMVGFYRRMQEGESPAEALRRAQLAIRHNGQLKALENTARPYMFAPFIVVNG